MAELPEEALPIVSACISLARFSGRLTEEEWAVVRPLAEAWAREEPRGSSGPIRDRDNRPMPLALLRRLLTAAAPGNAHTCGVCGRLVVEPDS